MPNKIFAVPILESETFGPYLNREAEGGPLGSEVVGVTLGPEEPTEFPLE